MQIIISLIYAQNYYKNRFLRNLFNIPWNPYHDLTFDGLAKNYKEAIKKINQSKKYKNITSTTKLFNKQDLKLDQLKPNNICLQTRDIILPLFVCLSKKIKLLDFGGGYLPIGLSVIGMSGINIQTTVIERKNLVNYINKKKLINDKLKKYFTYEYNLKNIKLKNYNVAYFGSSIQYFKNYKSILNKIFQSKISTIIISDAWFNFTKKNFYSLQIQERNCLYPCNFLSYSETLKLFKSNGYQLIFSSVCSKNLYKHSILKNEEFELKSLIFSKNKFNKTISGDG